MALFAVDTSCIVAAICSWHEHHEAAAAEIEKRLGRRDQLCVPAPALVEAYAVLTRLPAPHRLSAKDAWALIEANFVTDAIVAALDADRYVELLRGAVQANLAGGRTYDVVIGQCAHESGAEVLLTFNRRHFDPAPTGLRIVEPAPS